MLKKTIKKIEIIIFTKDFNKFYLYYLFIKYLCIIFQTVKSPSSRGLGHCPITAATGVRIPLGTTVSRNKHEFKTGKSVVKKYEILLER